MERELLRMTLHLYVYGQNYQPLVCLSLVCVVLNIATIFRMIMMDEHPRLFSTI